MGGIRQCRKVTGAGSRVVKVPGILGNAGIRKQFAPVFKFSRVARAGDDMVKPGYSLNIQGIQGIAGGAVGKLNPYGEYIFSGIGIHKTRVFACCACGGDCRGCENGIIKSPDYYLKHGFPIQAFGNDRIVVIPRSLGTLGNDK